MRLSIATRTFVGFTVVLGAFAVGAALTVRDLGQIAEDLALLNEGWLPLTRAFAELESYETNRTRELARIREAADPETRAVYMRLARLYGPVTQGEKLAAARAALERVKSRAARRDEALQFLHGFDERLEVIAQRQRDSQAYTERVFAAWGDDGPADADARARGREAAESGLRVQEAELARELKLGSLSLDERIRRAALQIERDESRVVWGTVLSTIGALAVGLAVMALLHRTLRPLRTLSEAVRRVARGDYAHAMPLRGLGSHEVGALAEDVGQMAEALREREAALRALHAYRENIVQSIRAGIVVADEALRVTSINRAACELWGLDATAVLGRPLESLPLGLADATHERLAEVAAGRRELRFESSVARRDGEAAAGGVAGHEPPATRLVDVAVLPFLDGGRAPAGVLLIADDVSERERVKQRLLHAERLAAIGRMAAQIAHEVRNPLNAIALNAELLRDEFSRDADATQSLQTLLAEVDRLTEVTEEWLRFARLPRGRRQSESVGEIVESLVAFVGAELQRKGVRVTLALAPSTPRVLGDENQLRQALLNILRNAVDALPDGGSVRIETRPIEDGRGVEIAVTDDGVGIAPEHLDRVFEPFFTTKEQGTGVGLALTQQIVGEHGGRIAVESVLGRGTTFRVTLPSEPDARRLEGERGAAGDGEGGAARGGAAAAAAGPARPAGRVAATRAFEG